MTRRGSPSGSENADLTEPEIAHIMGVATGTVSASLHAGRQQLSRTLAEHEEVTGG